MTLLRKTCHIATLTVIFLAIVSFVEPFLLLVSGIAVLMFVGAPLLLFGLVRVIYDCKSGSYGTGLRVIRWVVVMTVFIVLGVWANRFVYARAEAAAFAYPAQVIPLLEAYREAHGSYPTRLDDLPARPSIPRLLQRRGSYASWQGGYRFSFSAPADLMDSWTYDSSVGKWHVND
jgi:hypothetical protein